MTYFNPAALNAAWTKFSSDLGTLLTVLTSLQSGGEDVSRAQPCLDALTASLVQMDAVIMSVGTAAIEALAQAFPAPTGASGPTGAAGVTGSTGASGPTGA